MIPGCSKVLERVPKFRGAAFDWKKITKFQGGELSRKINVMIPGEGERGGWYRHQKGVSGDPRLFKKVRFADHHLLVIYNPSCSFMVPTPSTPLGYCCMYSFFHLHTCILSSCFVFPSSQVPFSYFWPSSRPWTIMACGPFLSCLILR